MLPQRGGGRMTAEVVIVNRNAISMAADSAVTVGRDRVWKYANKLFSCGPHNDAGVMMYNTGDFLGVPWETVIKEFRCRCGATRFKTVTDLSDNLIDFIQSSTFSDDEEEKASFLLILYDRISNIKARLSKPRNAKEFANALETHLTALMVKFAAGAAVFVLDRALFDKTYMNFIRSSSKEVFKPNKLSDGDIKKIVDYLFEFLSRQHESDFSTGLVVAGYGSEELFPSIINFEVDGRWQGTRVWKKKTWNYNGKGKQTGGMVIPFAQRDMLHLFMEGISVNYLSFLRRSIRGILKKKSDAMIDQYVADPTAKALEVQRHEADNKTILDGLFDEFDKYRDTVTVNPTIRTITSLPKEEMASMAEALVELTALKRKIGPTLESVGGPVDVAVISKGDGFIWIKRKHYFGIEHNLEFAERKRIRIGGSGS